VKKLPSLFVPCVVNNVMFICIDADKLLVKYEDGIERWLLAHQVRSEDKSCSSKAILPAVSILKKIENCDCVCFVYFLLSLWSFFIQFYSLIVNHSP